MANEEFARPMSLEARDTLIPMAAPHRGSAEQNGLELRLSRLENSVVFRLLRSIGFSLLVQKRKFGQRILKSPVHALYVKLVGSGRTDVVYENWLRQQDARTPSWDLHREQARQWPHRPLISVLMATRKPKPEWLDAAVDSVLAQSYPFLEYAFAMTHRRIG